MSPLPFITALALCLLTSALLATGPAKPPEAMIEPTWFEVIDGMFAKAEYIDVDIKTGDRLFVRYSPIADSGVELELVRDTTILWRKHVQPLGVEHSKYNHQVFFSISPFTPHTLHVRSMGEKTIWETRSLKDGRLISRIVRNN